MDVDVIRAPGPNRRVAHGETIPRWSKSSRLALGLWTATVPALAAACALWGVLAPAREPNALFGVVLGTIVAHFIVTAMYCAFAAQNPRLRMRSTWLAALVFGGPVTIPLYWFMHVWHAPQVGRDDVDENVPGFDVHDARAEGLVP